MAIDVSALESSIEALEGDAERYEQSAESANARVDALEEALSRLTNDAVVLEQVRENATEAAGEAAEAERMRESVARDLGDFNRQLTAQMQELEANRQTLSRLEAIGEDVSEATSVLDERQAWLEACRERMVTLGDRLDIAVEAYDIRGASAQGDSLVATESGVEPGATPVGMRNPVEQGFVDDMTSDFNLVAADDGLGQDAGPVSYRIIDWDAPKVDPRIQGTMDLLHEHLVREMRPHEEEQVVMALTRSLGGSSTTTTPAIVWPPEEDLVAEYGLFRNAAISAGASQSDLDAFDNEFGRALRRYRQARDAAHGAGHVGGGAMVTPGYGPGVKPPQAMYEAAKRRSDPLLLSQEVKGLAFTREAMHAREGGGTIYDSPTTQAGRLNWRQGLSSKKFQGTCGICSVQNVARMSGKNLSEADIVHLAAAHGLCETGSHSPGDRGGTSSETRQQLLSLVGIRSHLDYDQSCEHIASLVESGRGVIASVDVRQFWSGAIPFDQAGGHAVTLTSVERDGFGAPVRFHFCDSGLGDADYSVDATQFMVSLRAGRGLNVTDSPIR